MKLKKKIISRYVSLCVKSKLIVVKWYIAVRKWFLFKWTKISEENRKKFISSLSVTLNFFLNALLLSIPVTLLLHVPYWKSVLCIGVLLPFLEHYYIWIRETWKDNVLK